MWPSAIIISHRVRTAQLDKFYLTLGLRDYQKMESYWEKNKEGMVRFRSSLTELDRFVKPVF